MNEHPFSLKDTTLKEQKIVCVCVMKTLRIYCYQLSYLT